MIKWRILVLVMSLGGCYKVGPDYHKPEVATPENWRFAPAAAQETANLPWWRQLDDPVLDDLIEQALANNLDLKIAVANVEQYLGAYGSIRANLFPQLSGSAAYARQQASGNANADINYLYGKIPDTDYASFGPSLNWELDIWGQLRRYKEAASADLLGQSYAQHALTLTVVSLTAQTYVNLLTLDAILDITRQTVSSLEEQDRINKVRFEMGYTSKMEWQQSSSELERRRALLPQYEQQIAQTEHALCVLLGRNPGPIPRGKTLGTLQAPAIPAGLPSELLNRRPDIQQAEQALIAANARIGAALGEYYPKLLLTGGIGETSVAMSRLFVPGTNYWTIGTQLFGPIFTAGKIAGQVKSAEAAATAAMANYQKTVITGFSEFENALVASVKSRERQHSQGQRVGHVQDYLHLAKINYAEGNTAYISVLDALRQFYEAQTELAQARSDTLTANIQIYKAMGGGWIVEAEQAAGIPAKPGEAQLVP